jgi:hypothetical protein
MPPTFQKLSLERFESLLDELGASGGRRIGAVDVHHTWRPTHAQYRGEASIDAMWRDHVQRRGFTDIAQHLTIGPDGSLWTGRPWSWPPASAVGFNGNSRVGPFMFEMIGDFDRGQDPFHGAQREAAIGVTARILTAFGLGVDAIRFHNEMSGKTCPGSAIVKRDFVEDVRAVMEALPRAQRSRESRSWAPSGVRASEDVALSALVRGEAPALRGEGELPEEDMSDTEAGLLVEADAVQSLGRERGEQALTPAELVSLRPYVVNLRAGLLSSEGSFSTSEADVASLFDYHLKRAVDAVKQAPHDEQRTLKIVLWAHGGLSNEAAGLRVALRQVAWWRKNRVYPIFFVWETGFWDAIEQLLRGGQARSTRDLADWTTDPVIETLAGVMTKVWTAMKVSAARASAPGGGAHLAAGRLRDFAREHAGHVELHAVGHSAGAIFQSHFLPVLTDGGVTVRSLQLLAPALRVDEFKERLAPLVERQVQRLTMYTMARDYERADSVGPYRKSLLYLVSRALEGPSAAHILGLEESVRDDADTASLFGLRSTAGSGDVVWSVSENPSGPYASRSTTHGGFDNDPATMNAVCERVRGTAPLEGYREDGEARGLGALWWKPAPAMTGSNGTAPALLPAPTLPLRGPQSGSGRRLALCIGINDYPRAPLRGCVADAREWQTALGRLGFDVTLLLDAEATHHAILGRIELLVREARRGDVVVVQFAGHGTEVPDVDGDEQGGSNGAKDEALCPIDLDRGALVIDDDLARVFSGIPDGVSVTCFFDCCHSGTATRLGGVGPVTGDDTELRPRFVVATTELEARHRAFRASLGSSRALGRAAGEYGKEILFAACQPEEVAYESGGHGEFTLRATPLLSEGASGLSNLEFQRRVERAFGERPRQRPKLSCDPAAYERPLLGEWGGATNGRRDVPLVMPAGPAFEAAGVAQALHAMATEIEARTGNAGRTLHGR